MKLVIFGFAVVAAAPATSKLPFNTTVVAATPASTTNDSEYTTIIRVGS